VGAEKEGEVVKAKEIIVRYLSFIKEMEDEIMAADLHIHVFEGITEDDLRIFFARDLGSKYFVEDPEDLDWEKWDEAYDKIANTPNVWVGEVSWLKAWLLEDDDAFIPAPVQAVAEIIGEDLPEITDELIERVVEAMRKPNETGYSVNSPEEIERFLKEHKGKRVFVVTW